MSYHINVEVTKMDIRVPAADALSLLDDEDVYDDEVSISKSGLRFGIDEQSEGTVVPLDKGFYVFNKQTVPHLGGNKSPAEDVLRRMAIKYAGDFEARFTGEEGDTWAVKVNGGVEKKVRVIVEEI